MEKKYSVALVEYLNTLPFSAGIQMNRLEAHYHFIHATPAQCAQLFEEGRVDISLCPVGALGDMPPHEIKGEFCIGADGVVDTVVLLSKVPLDKITTVKLDDHSRTSNQLIQLLAERLWNKKWTFHFDQMDEDEESCLVIGDKVFERKQQYPYQYDLAAAWKELTGLPIVFAVWIARPDVSEEVIDDINEACRVGLEYIRRHDTDLALWQKEYLLERISYPLDEAKRKGMKLFLSWSAMLEPMDIIKRSEVL